MGRTGKLEIMPCADRTMEYNVNRNCQLEPNTFFKGSGSYLGKTTEDHEEIVVLVSEQFTNVLVQI